LRTSSGNIIQRKMMRQALAKKGILVTSIQRGGRNRAGTTLDSRIATVRMCSGQFSTNSFKGEDTQEKNKDTPSLPFLSNNHHQYMTQMTKYTTTGVNARSFSTSSKEEKDDKKANNEEEETTTTTDKEQDETKESKEESFEDKIKRLKGEKENTEESSSFGFDKDNELHRSFADKFAEFSAAVSETWKELLNAGSARDINKKIHAPKPTASPETANYEDDNAAADKYEGTTAMVIDEEENLSAWERMEQRLKDAPIIKNILEQTEQIYEKSGAAKAKEKIDDIKHDAQEAWETSQNPWVYRVSSVYDTVTAESEDAAAVRELRKLDPEFTLEGWKHDVIHHTIPNFMNLFLQGRIKELKPWLGEAVYNRLAAEIRARNKDGVLIDTNILGIMNSEILACHQDHFEKGSPIILLHFMCQQIHCVRKKEDDSIVEGGEDDIRANSYVMGFQRVYEEDKGELNWKIVDFRFNGAMAYL